MTDVVGRLDRLTLAELDDLHYECEAHYRDRILSSVRGTAQRSALFSEAYGVVVAILEERRRRHGVPMGAMGLCAGTSLVVAGLLGPPPARIFDVGCGAGVLVEALLERGYETRGLDVAPRLIALGRERMASNPRVRSRSREALALDNFLDVDLNTLGRGSYDLVHSNDVLEHLHPDDAPAFMERVSALLRPGGYFWLVTPNHWTGPGDATQLRHPLGTPAKGLHLHEYTLGELTTLLHTSGFGSVRARLWAGGRFRKESGFRVSYARVKLAAEPALSLLPPRWRKRLMGVMDYASVLAQKPMQAP